MKSLKGEHYAVFRANSKTHKMMGADINIVT